MNVEEKIVGSLFLIRLSGEFTTDDVESLHQTFQNALKKKKRIVLELGFSKVGSYVILQPLLQMASTLKSKKETLVVAKATGNLRFVLTMLNKQDWFEFHEAINDLVIEESNKQTTAFQDNQSEDLKPVYYQVPDVTEFKLD